VTTEKAAVNGRRADILAAAAALFATRGIEATSVREIGERVGLNPGALYHYFPSKSAIARDLITGYLTDLLADYRAAGLDGLEPRARLKAIVDISLATGAARPDETKIYHAEFPNLRRMRDYEHARDVTDEIQSIWLAAIEAGKDDGTLRRDVPTKVFHRFLRDAVWFSVYWRKDDESYPLDELSDHCLAVFLDGMANRLS